MFTGLQLSAAIKAIVPGAEFTFTNADLSTLVWMSPNIQQPTVEAIMAQANAMSYVENRRANYPPAEDLADALVHQQMGDGGTALQAYLQKCINVKTQFPKP